jgi:hypothetical protein
MAFLMRLESRGVDYQRRARSRRAAWAALAWFAAVIAYAWLAGGPPVTGAPTFWLYLGSFVAALVGATTLVRLRFYPALTAPTAARRPAMVSVGEGAIVVEYGRGVWRWPLSDVVEGWTESFQDEDDVVLRTRRDDLVAVRVDSPEAGSALLRAVGVSADKQVVRLRLAERSASSAPVGCIAGAAGVVLPFALVGSGVGLWFAVAAILRRGAPDSGLWVFAAIFAASLLAAFKVLQAMVPPLATVGVDGIEVRGFGSRRFIPLDDVSRVDSSDRGVTLRLRSGPDLTLTTFRNTSDGRQGHPATRAALLRRIEQALAARRASQSQVARAAALERHGKSFARWRVELASLTKQDADYRRSAGLARDDLERILEDASAPVEHRVGAAVALTAAGDGDVRRRVRIAAAACADQSLRAALEAAAEQELDEDKLERALRRVHEA